MSAGERVTTAFCPADAGLATALRVALRFEVLTTETPRNVG
jgi:hypothetical protein